jgi:hypothetical protein
MVVQEFDQDPSALDDVFGDTQQGSGLFGVQDLKRLGWRRRERRRLLNGPLGREPKDGALHLDSKETVRRKRSSGIGYPTHGSK